MRDSFELLIEWVELLVQIIEKAREEITGFDKRKSGMLEGRRGRDRNDRVCGRNFGTRPALLTPVNKTTHAGFAKPSRR